MSAGHRHTPPNHHVVEVDEDYRISRLDRTVVVTDVDVCVELPSDEVLVGHTIRIVAGAGDVIVCTCSAAIEKSDEDGQLVIPRGRAVELTLSDDKCNCSKVWVPDCCPETPSPTPRPPCAADGSQEQGSLVTSGLLFVAGPDPAPVGVFAPLGITAVRAGRPSADARSWIVTTVPLRQDLEIVPVVSAAVSTSSTGAPDVVYNAPFAEPRLRVLSVTPTGDGCAIYDIEVWLVDATGTPIDPFGPLPSPLSAVVLTAFVGAAGGSNVLVSA